MMKENESASSIICVEGYKAFRGDMTIKPVSGATPFTLAGNWLYKPESDCWYGHGQSFGAEICEVSSTIHDGQVQRQIYSS